MRALTQRVTSSAVTHTGTGERHAIGKGLLVLLGVGTGDTEAQAAKLAEKLVHLRIFSNEGGKFDLSLLDIKGECLVVSQFTLYGDASKGRRPDFTQAAPPAAAEALYGYFIERLRSLGVAGVHSGWFQAPMTVEIVNDGPVTLMLEI